MLGDFVGAAWSRLCNLAVPQVPEARLHEAVDEARKTMRPPVFWLLGKSGQGKTSIIRGLTGRSDTEIGKGFRPCTQTAQLYSFPSESDCQLQFLDTRGLGDSRYDPAADLDWLHKQSHCLIVVVRAMDHAQQDVVETLRKVWGDGRERPTLVCQTALHDGYTGGETEHGEYGYDEGNIPGSTPAGLARSLCHQRSLFAEFGIGGPAFVPLDFTYSDHGQRVYEPHEFGLDALWEAIDRIFPLGLREVVRQDNELRKKLTDVHFEAAHPHVVAYALGAGGIGAIPMPYVDIPLVLAMQSKMAHSIAAIYDQPLSAALLAKLLGWLGLGYLLRFGLREAIKIIPGIGTIAGATVSGFFAATTTYGLGFALCKYFQWESGGMVPSRKLFREWYREGLSIGASRFAKTFQRKTGEGTA